MTECVSEDYEAWMGYGVGCSVEDRMRARLEG